MTDSFAIRGKGRNKGKMTINKTFIVNDGYFENEKGIVNTFGLLKSDHHKSKLGNNGFWTHNGDVDFSGLVNWGNLNIFNGVINGTYDRWMNYKVITFENCKIPDGLKKFGIFNWKTTIFKNCQVYNIELIGCRELILDGGQYYIPVIDNHIFPTNLIIKRDNFTITDKDVTGATDYLIVKKFACLGTIKAEPNFTYDMNIFPQKIVCSHIL